MGEVWGMGRNGGGVWGVWDYNVAGSLGEPQARLDPSWPSANSHANMGLQSPHLGPLLTPPDCLASQPCPPAAIDPGAAVCPPPHPPSPTSGPQPGLCMNLHPIPNSYTHSHHTPLAHTHTHPILPSFTPLTIFHPLFIVTQDTHPCMQHTQTHTTSTHTGHPYCHPDTHINIQHPIHTQDTHSLQYTTPILSSTCSFTLRHTLPHTHTTSIHIP